MKGDVVHTQSQPRIHDNSNNAYQPSANTALAPAWLESRRLCCLELERRTAKAWGSINAPGRRAASPGRSSDDARERTERRHVAIRSPVNAPPRREHRIARQQRARYRCLPDDREAHVRFVAPALSALYISWGFTRSGLLSVFAYSFISRPARTSRQLTAQMSPQADGLASVAPVGQ
jgi:hypothetical protein